MKIDIQPKYYPKANVHCACGNNFTVGSTKEIIETEVCSNCHPFYTKKEKIMDTMGRVQKFKAKLEKKSTTVKKVKNPRARKLKAE
jgi:large subunit ribosomal protein L31